MVIAALTFVCVPPAVVCKITDEFDVWFLIVKISPAFALKITDPLVMIAPEPEPNVVPEMMEPFKNNAN